MQTQPQEFAPPSIGGPSPAPERKLIAPVWHTMVLTLILLANSYFTARSLPKIAAGSSPQEHTLGYVLTIGWQIVLFVIVWLGVRSRGITIKELIGGRWESVEDFLIDVGIAFGAFVAAFLMAGALGYLVGLTNSSQMAEAKKLIDIVAPRSPRALAVFILLSTCAGFNEEIIFRGYFQRQFAALTGNIYVALIIQAIIFGLGHGYEGPRRMVIIFGLGCLFGLLALARKSLRPGMITHASFDSVQGVILYLVKKGVIPTS